MLKAYKYRIYPTEEQKVFFDKTFGSCRLVWTLMLAERETAFKNGEIIPLPSPAKYKNQYHSYAKLIVMHLTICTYD
jgi:putative transposase